MALMDRLEAAGHPLFDREARGEPAALYRAHFLLFHALYHLRPALAEAGLGLEIHCLCIRLYPLAGPTHGDGTLIEADPLAAFYLDPQNLEGMDNAAVERLIADGLCRALGGGDRAEDLAELGLPPGARRAEIRRRYRRLAMRHHPDRGGDTATLQRINDAYQRLMAR